MLAASSRQNEISRLKEEAAELGRYSIHIAIVLSIVFSLTAVVILSRQHMTHQLRACIVAVVVPMPIALYFRSRIALLGVFAYVAALIVALVAAVMFGI